VTNDDDMAAAVRAAVQAVLDAHGDGWHVAQFVISMGLERVSADGELESSAWVWTPPNQADWMTDGLLEAASDIRCIAGIDDD
jgi:hypothetical protein